MGNLAKYEAWKPEEIDEEVDALDAESDFLKVKVGRTVLRFLPKRAGTAARSPLVKVYQHYLDIPGLSNSVSFNCPRMMAKRVCPVCRKVEELRGTGNPADYDMAGEIKAGKRVYANVIDRAHPERGPVIFAFGKLIHEELLAFAHNPDWGDFTDPTEAGYDITITRTGTGKTDTRYKVSGARECTPLSADPEQMEQWLEVMHDLDRFLRVPSEEELERMLPGSFLQPPPERTGRGRQLGGRRRGPRAQDEVLEGEIVED